MLMHVDISINFTILTESPESQYPKVAVKVRNWILAIAGSRFKLAFHW